MCKYEEAFCLFNHILHLVYDYTDINFDKLSQSVTTWNVGYMCWLPESFWLKASLVHKAAELTSTVSVCPKALMAVVHIPAYFSYCGQLLLTSSYLQQSKAFVHVYFNIIKDWETLIAHSGNFAVDFTKDRINPSCQRPKPCKPDSIIRKAHIQRIKLTVYSSVCDFSSTAEHPILLSGAE